MEAKMAGKTGQDSDLVIVVAEGACAWVRRRGKQGSVVAGGRDQRLKHMPARAHRPGGDVRIEEGGLATTSTAQAVLEVGPLHFEPRVWDGLGFARLFPTEAE
jgi:hypothetical protein